jgi:hypothetical protein
MMTKLYCVTMLGGFSRHYSTKEKAIRRAMQLAAVCDTSVEITIHMRRARTSMTRAGLIAKIHDLEPPFGSVKTIRTPELEEGETIARLKGLVEMNNQPKNYDLTFCSILEAEGFPV